MSSRKHEAQVMLEYMIIAVVVMLAILFGGSFLANSVGAHFRNMENHTEDSFGEYFTLVGGPAGSTGTGTGGVGTGGVSVDESCGSCDDGNPCTTDVCASGTCLNVVLDASCDPATAGTGSGSTDTGTQTCVPSCANKQCGSDGCTGSCGTCGGRTPRCINGKCTSCYPNCTNKDCGSDGCGGSCGTCTSGHICNSRGKCT